jgi:peptidyl-dipeptidase A
MTSQTSPAHEGGAAPSLDEIRAAVDAVVVQLRRLDIAANLTAWDAAVKGTPENLQKAADARTEAMKFAADPGEYARFRDWDRSGAAAGDAQLARMVRVLHNLFAGNQNDPALIEQISGLIQKLEEVYYGFRATVDGKSLSNNQIEKILDTEMDSEIRREVWEAHKQLGPLVAPSIRELAHLRNRAAQNMGYANFHRMSLELNEIDPDWLYQMLEDLAMQTQAPFERVKAELDQALSKRFQVPVAELRPWHYSDLFFQRAPAIGDTDFEVYFKDQDLVALATETYDSLGMDVRDILTRSDLYERELKDQHAFCIHIDREGDIRTLNNLVPSERWMDTLLHELGHGVYDKYIPQSLPWLLRTIPHILSTEAMALLMGSQTLDTEWLVRIRGLDRAEAVALSAAATKREILAQLIFARWVMVVVGFERAMYENPDQDLDTLWWDLVEKYQLLHRPEGRHMPDWATKNHIALAPAYYQNYLLGQMVAAQWQHTLRAKGGLIGNPDAGAWFKDRVFGTGATLPWNDALAFATGEPLNLTYYAQQYVETGAV